MLLFGLAELVLLSLLVLALLPLVLLLSLLVLAAAVVSVALGPLQGTTPPGKGIIAGAVPVFAALVLIGAANIIGCWPVAVG